MSKIGEPAPLSDTAEDLIRKSQVSELVSKLSPDQVVLQQKRVQEYFIEQNELKLTIIQPGGNCKLVAVFCFLKFVHLLCLLTENCSEIFSMT